MVLECWWRAGWQSPALCEGCRSLPRLQNQSVRRRAREISGAINLDALEAIFETGKADELLRASALVRLPLHQSPAGAMAGGRVQPERRSATSRIRLQSFEAHRH